MTLTGAGQKNAFLRVSGLGMPIEIVTGKKHLLFDSMERDIRRSIFPES